VVAYRALGLGDFLTGVPAYRALRAAFPDDDLVLAAPPQLAGLAPLTRAIDRVVPTAPLEAPPVADTAVAINLHGRGPQSHRAVLASGPRRLVAFACAGVSHDGPGWTEDEHEVARWCRMLTESGIPADGSPERLRIDAPRRPAPRHAVGATVIHPGAASAARRWPPARYAAVARSERAAGRAVVVTGGAPEVRVAREVAERAGLGARAVLAGRTDLADVAAVVAAAARVVCGDTGMAHLATALGTPSVVLFGPTSPAHWGPPPDGRHVALWAGLEGDPHATVPDPGLLQIEVAAVRQALDTLVAS
jgi:ADP-heptose:LPS heptosyltransferase